VFEHISFAHSLFITSLPCRDIKPANVLLHADGHAMLADFGLARIADESQLTAGVGSSSYMAPEVQQVLWDVREYDCKADVWSLGALAFELYTGRKLISSDAERRALHAAYMAQDNSWMPTRNAMLAALPTDLKGSHLRC
jgi:serine/threonine protein kinase